MIKHPIERHDRRVKFTHEILSNVVDTARNVSRTSPESPESLL